MYIYFKVMYLFDLSSYIYLFTLRPYNYLSTVRSCIYLFTLSCIYLLTPLFICLSLSPQHSEAMQLVDPFYSVVFLEMGWGGAARGRVHIRLTPNDRRGQQFLSLCTGQGGRSYVDTQLLQVGYKGRPGEYVVGGGLDDVAMEEEELGRECQKRASVGLVWGWCEAEGHTGPSSLGSGSRFAITTKHPGPGTSYCRVFGKVEAGLEVLKAATKLKDITEVTVLDCGIVVTF